MPPRVNLLDGVSTETKQDAIIDALTALLSEMQQKLEAGQAIALDAATLAALETINANITGSVTVANPTDVSALGTEATLQSILAGLQLVTATIDNFPADYPDADTHTALSGISTTLTSILTELGQKLEAGGEVSLSAASLAALESVTATVANMPSTFPLPLSQVQTDALTDAELRASPVPVSDSSLLTVLNDLLTELGQKLEAGGAVKLQVGGNDVTTLNPLPVSGQFTDSNGVPFDENNRLPVDIGADLTVDNLTVQFESVVSTLNIPPGPLAADEVFVGQWEEVTDYGSIAVALSTDASSTVNGAMVQFSHNGTDIIRSAQSTVIGGIQSFFEIPPEARYFRVHFTNGPVAQTYLHASIIYRFNPAGLLKAPLGAALTDLDIAGQVRAANVARLDDGSGLWSPMAVTSTGDLHTTDQAAHALLEVLRDAQAPVTPTAAQIASVVTDQALVTPTAGNAVRLRKFHLHLDPDAGSNNVVTLKVGSTVVFQDEFEPGLPYAETLLVVGESDDPITVSTTSSSRLYINLRHEEFQP